MKPAGQIALALLAAVALMIVNAIGELLTLVPMLGWLVLGYGLMCALAALLWQLFCLEAGR